MTLELIAFALILLLLMFIFIWATETILMPAIEEIENGVFKNDDKES